MEHGSPSPVPVSVRTPVDAIEQFGLTAEGLAWRTPSPRLLIMRRVELAVVALPLAVVALALSALALLAVVVCALAAEWFLRRRVHAWGYAEREDDLLVKRGVLVSRMSVVPYGRMQFVDVLAGPLERRLGLAAVHLHTAAAATDAHIPGLLADEAERLLHLRMLDGVSFIT